MEPQDQPYKGAKMTMRRLVLPGALILALSLIVGLAVSQTAAAKKKGGKAAVVSGSIGAIPNGPTTFSSGIATTSPVPFLGTATVGKKFKGKRVGDVDATISLSGVSKAGTTCGGICNTRIRLTAPNGATTSLLSGGTGDGDLTGNLVSSLTLSDQTATLTCGGPAGPGTPPPPPCFDPDATLLPPYTGTAQPFAPLHKLNGSPVKGTWVLTGTDICGTSLCGDQGTSSVTKWSLRITPAKAGT
jgi:hypothetical protein